MLDNLSIFKKEKKILV